MVSLMNVADKDPHSDLEGRLRAVSAQYCELLADLTDFKARASREAQRRADESVRAILLDQLVTVDGLDRALAAAEPGDSVMQGVELVRQQLLDSLARYDVRPIPAMGARFDANLHEGTATWESQDPKDDGRVVEVHRMGYCIGDDVLRPARVSVGTFTPNG